MAVGEVLCVLALLQPVAPRVSPEPTLVPAPREQPPAANPREAPATDSSSAVGQPTPSAELGGPILEREAPGIAGTIVDATGEHLPLAGVHVRARCHCAGEPAETWTDDDGGFELELPAGVYSLEMTRGGPATQRVVTLGPGARVVLELAVRPPPSTADIALREYTRGRNAALLGLGGVAGVTALVLVISAGVENAKRECKFDRDDCAAAPRRGATVGLAVTGGVLAGVAAALIGVGVHRRRQLKARFAADDRSASVTVSGRF